jgi:hypothetical protein
MLSDYLLCNQILDSVPPHRLSKITQVALSSSLRLSIYSSSHLCFRFSRLQTKLFAMDETTNGASSDLGNRNYIRWDAEGVEKIPPNEAEDIKAVAEQLNCIQRAMFNRGRHCFGGRSRLSPVIPPAYS